MPKVVKSALIGILLVLAMLVVFLCSNLLAQALPRDAIEAHLEQSEDSYLFERIYTYDHQDFGSYTSYDNNRYIKSVALQHDHGSLFATSVLATVDDYSMDQTVTFDYFRYWHGWQLISDLCLMVGQIWVLQLVVFLLVLGFSAWFVFELHRYEGWFAAVAFYLVAFFSANILGNFLGDITLCISMIAPVAFGAAILRVGHIAKPDYSVKIGFLCLLAGGTYVFLDFLTLPAFAAALVTFCALLATADLNTTVGSAIKRFIAYAVLFGVGFACIWAGKWLLVILLIGPEAMAENISGEATRWVSDGYGYLLEDPLYSKSPLLFILIKTAKKFLKWCPAGIAAVVFVFGVLAAYVVMAVARRNKSHNENRGQKPMSLWLLLMPLTIELAYYIVMMTHAAFHIHVFTYKNVSIVLAIIAFIGIVGIRRIIQSSSSPSIIKDASSSENKVVP